MPQGNTNSTTVTSAASDVSTGVPMGTLDQISHTDVNVSGNDCGLCHSQAGISTTGTKGKEWAQATFHKNFGANKPLMMNTTTGRCSNCHMNVKPGASYAGQDHSAFTSASGTEDCSSCHSWPGTGTAASPNWLGAAGGMPVDISVGGFSISQPPATVATVQVGIDQLPHPTVANGVQCTTCHAANNFKPSNGYDHKSALINSNCAACHEAGSTLVGTVWNHAATESAGAGDTRPIGLTSLGHVDKPTVATMQAHFYPIDCSQCHNVPPGNGLTSTGGAYVGNGIGSPSGATCAPSGTQCASTGVACSNTAPCPNGQSCKNAVCVPNCPNGQSCKSSQCVVDCPNGQSCNNQICYLPPFWTFPHNEKKMSNPSTCVTCHTNGVPN
jgi:hypothetical protein